MSETTPKEQYPSTAFTLSLVAGTLMVVSGTLVVMAGLVIRTLLSLRAEGGFMGMMGFGPGPLWIFGGMILLGLISGIIVLVSAIMVKRRPSEYNTWGVLILVFSVLSFFGFGGFFIGAILGIVGGALVLSWKPGQTQ